MTVILKRASTFSKGSIRLGQTSDEVEMSFWGEYTPFISELCPASNLWAITNTTCSTIKIPNSCFIDAIIF